MNNLQQIEFNGDSYFDDRLFVLYLCSGDVKIEEGDDGVVWTTIYHENPPENHLWCVVTYKNCKRYPLYRVDCFYNKENAIAYIRKIEPETPLISLNGGSPEISLSYDRYIEWKRENNLGDYNWKSLYSVDGKNASERIGQTKEQFKGIN